MTFEDRLLPGIRVTSRGACRVITLGSRESLCTLSSEVVDALLHGTRPASFSDERVLVIESANRAFCGGFNLREASSQEATAERFLAIQALIDQFRSLPVVTLAVLDGAAVGAGADLAIACDIRIGTARASFRFPGVRFGVILGTDQLIRRAGADRAMQLMLDQESVKGNAALQAGLLTMLVEADVVDESVDRLIDQIDDIPRDVVARLLDLVRSDDRSSHLRRLRDSMSDPRFHARLAAFASSIHSSRS